MIAALALIGTVLVYDMRMSSAGMNGGAVPGMAISLTIQNADPDGTRHASLKLDMPHAPEMPCSLST